MSKFFAAVAAISFAGLAMAQTSERTVEGSGVLADLESQGIATTSPHSELQFDPYANLEMAAPMPDSRSQAVPEPATMIGLAAAGAFMAARRKKKSA
jgi:hypothetical protein